MSQGLELKFPETHLPPDDWRKENLFPETHEDDMGETTIHYDLISDFIKMLKLFFLGQPDIFIAANLNFYYDENDSKKYYIPDIMIAFGVSNHSRKTYKLWEEKLCPQVVFEVASESTWKKDITDKVEDYEKLGVEEYYILDSENLYLSLPLMAYRRDETGRFRLVVTETERIFSPLLGLEIVRTENRFRLFDPEKQEFLLTAEEAQKKVDEVQLENEHLKAELDRLKAELKKQN
ncbi:MAG: Uma2 family endonuclease [Pyrinomonadaceae bacterium]